MCVFVGLYLAFRNYRDSIGELYIILKIMMDDIEWYKNHVLKANIRVVARVFVFPAK